MYTTRDSALAAGELRYISGKPCRRGHNGPRYASSGNCIECVAEMTTIKQIKTKMARRKGIADRTKEPHFHGANYPLEWHAILDKLNIIANGTDQALQQRIIATINGAPLEWDSAAFYKAGVHFNGQYITNAHQFPVGTPFSIRIGDLWWPGADLMACLRGERPTVSPCNYIPTLE